MRDIPRVSLATLPTPITDAVRLRDALGGPSRCPRILIKRDDLTGLGLGGNKARKLEFLVADALAQGAHTVVTTGAIQSNHARMTAAAACIAGLRAVLVLTKKFAMPRVEGNLFIDYLYGAEIRFVNAESDLLAVGRDEEAVAEVVKNEAAKGRNAYVIPVGGSSGVGAVGYVTGTRELLDQLRTLGVTPSRLYYASGSRGTQAGLALGAKLYSAPYRLWGVAVSGGEAEKIQRARKAASDAAALLGATTRVDLDELFTDQGFIGEGYGIPTDEGLQAIRLLARTEAILLDPVYTSKGFAALLRHIRTGEVSPDDTVIFLHTGGMPALFTREFKAHSQAFRA
jgi:D-cysteine desulfhydrase family pyridoxal phosphate-dependent enzyme